MKRFLLLLSIIAMTIFFASSLYAQQQQTASLQVSATVVPACTVSVQDIDFGDISASGYVSANGNIQVNCSDGTIYDIALDKGQHYANSTRQLADASQNLISYALYKDPNHTDADEWGDAGYDNTYSAQPLGDIGNGSTQDHIVYGLANMSVIVPPGSYSDVVQVTVYY